MTYAKLDPAKVEAAATKAMAAMDELARVEKIGRGDGYFRLKAIVALAAAAQADAADMTVTVDDFALLAPGWNG